LTAATPTWTVAKEKYAMSKELPTARSQHRTPVASTPALPAHVAPTVRAGTHSGGAALEKHTQATMSARFGHDFSQVRIHTDHRPVDSAAEFGASAYAVGSDIVFGGGKYNPGSRETERLLAHELTHVAQQSRFGIGDWGRMSHHSDASQREADTVAAQIAMGRSVSVQAAPGAAVARDIGDVIDPAPPPPEHIPSPTPS
jgi:hypothetical protein